MTNETAIHRLLLVRHRKDCTELLAEALNMAIEALQRGCENVAESCDVISRQDAVDAVKNGMCTFYDCDVIEAIQSLPPVQPERGCDECVFKPFKQFQPERKKGEWIWQMYENIYRCSECETETHVDECMEEPIYNYCPYCGADMMDET